MGSRINFTLQYPGGSSQRNGHHLATQIFLDAVELLIDLRTCSGQYPATFILGIVLGSFNNFGGTLVGTADNLTGLILGLAQQRLGTFLGQSLFTLAVFARSQAIGNLFLALFQSMQDRRPDILHAEYDKQEKGYRLANQGSIDIHVSTSTS